jgi:beta-galactosidase
LIVTEVHDFGVVLIDGVRVGTLDRMRGEKTVRLPAREKSARLDIVVEAMGHVQFGTYLGDRKGITERVELSDAYGSSEVLNWRMFPLSLESDAVSKVVADRSVGNSPALFQGEFKVREPADTFLDMRGWTKGMVWVNGHNLGRFWNIGPQQTLYLPGVWMRKGANEIRILDLLPPERPRVAGLTNAVLDQLDFASSGRLHRKDGQSFQSQGLKPVASGGFAAGVSAQVVRFPPVASRYVCLEAVTSQGGDPYSSCAEIQVLDSLGRSIPRDRMKVVFADSEELVNEDASADRVLDGQIDSYWHTQWNREDAPHPHQLVLDLGEEQVISGIQYIPRQDRINGRVGSYRIYTSEEPFPGL